MFSTSARRVTFAVPQVPTAVSFCISTIAPRIVSSQGFSYRSRRYSSSKPSSPADGSSGINELPAAPAKTKSKTQSKKKAAKDVAANTSGKGQDETKLHLPSVPSTQHIAPLQIGASDFFSLYRPMSLTHVFPKVVTEAAFAAIFAPKTKVNKPSDVISVLSSATQNIEASSDYPGLTNFELSAHEEEIWNDTDDVRAAVTAESYRESMETRRRDGALEVSLMEFPKHILSGRYTPFHPPPAPFPQNTPESLAAGAEAVKGLGPQYKTYTAMLTIEESTDANGDVTYMAHSSPLIEDGPKDSPAKFLQRMQHRREKHRIPRSEEKDMLAISVKRQRKLKMKKHKYKKLMRRTRNERRRLDRN
ncbi:hypothetical protein PZA11_004298 [Diplocarpon coronariae]|uniref:Small ribosomal subunit protein mS38 n=1 Tax=Diplocarpon coronariae TaxID=2795749 RepID=A0A218Z2Y3_9HELO|nr:hypothetical protein JHW43_006888 [Diplocarpon mali]OWP02451.1 hypothetical protein B2J93_4788 [Marssonina coronariae]